MRQIAAIITCGLLLGACMSGKQLPADIQRLDGALRSQLPEGTQPLDTYVRYYARIQFTTEDDLPFTTIADPGIPAGERPLIIGVLVQPGIWEDRRSGAYMVDDDHLPFAVHGGCSAVNVAYDAAAKKIVGLWCNVGDELPQGWQGY